MNFLAAYGTRAEIAATNAGKLNILLDFDKTVAGGHSGGRVFTPTTPMDSTNQEVFKTNVYKWLKAGHNVAIITRGIDEKISAYFRAILHLRTLKTPIISSYVSLI
jgi:hypothetical protein